MNEEPSFHEYFDETWRKKFYDSLDLWLENQPQAYKNIEPSEEPEDQSDPDSPLKWKLVLTGGGNSDYKCRLYMRLITHTGTRRARRFDLGDGFKVSLREALDNNLPKLRRGKEQGDDKWVWETTFTSRAEGEGFASRTTLVMDYKLELEFVKGDTSVGFSSPSTEKISELMSPES